MKWNQCPWDEIKIVASISSTRKRAASKEIWHLEYYWNIFALSEYKLNLISYLKFVGVECESGDFHGMCNEWRKWEAEANSACAETTTNLYVEINDVSIIGIKYRLKA